MLVGYRVPAGQAVRLLPFKLILVTLSPLPRRSRLQTGRTSKSAVMHQPKVCGLFPPAVMAYCRQAERVLSLSKITILKLAAGDASGSLTPPILISAF